MSRVLNAKLVSSLFLGVIGLAIVVFGQNCSRVDNATSFSSTSSSTTSSLTNGTGNGQGYDGMVIYASLLPAAQLCADGSPERARIQIALGTASLVRNNCVSISPQNLAPSDYSVFATVPQVLIYNSILFTNIFQANQLGTVSYACSTPPGASTAINVVVSSLTAGGLSASIARAGTSVAAVSVQQILPAPALSYIGVNSGLTMFTLSTLNSISQGGFNADFQFTDQGSTWPDTSLICYAP